jgi:hypothetical protein
MILGNQKYNAQYCQLLVLIPWWYKIITNYYHFNQINNRKTQLIIIFATEGLNYYTAFMCLKH